MLSEQGVAGTGRLSQREDIMQKDMKKDHMMGKTTKPQVDLESSFACALPF